MGKKAFDTTTFDRLSSEDYKERTKAQWSQDPCGANYTQKEALSREYFEEIEGYRYRTHPWIKEAIGSFDIENKNVLEIGFGMGTDHLNLAREGGKMHGIDLTAKHLDITRARLKLYGLGSNLTVGDAEEIPYADSHFDFVYSFGVMHHSPDTRKIVSEIYRVLKPGGECYVSVYNKNSIFFWWNVFAVNYLLKRGWKRRSLQQQLSLVEYPNINENMVIRVYKRKDFAALFQEFRTVRTYIRHLLPVDMAFISFFYCDQNSPRPFLSKLGRKFGWYIVLEAVK